MSTRLARFEGRLFAEGGCLFLVVHADEARDLARVTCRVDGRTQVVEMPLSAVARRLAASPTLMLDNLNGAASERRISHGQGGWYFSAREGTTGPFASRDEAGRALVRHVLCMQENGITGRASPRAGVAHRIEAGRGLRLRAG